MRRFDVRKVALDDYDWSEYDRLLGEFLRTYIDGENLRVTRKLEKQGGASTSLAQRWRKNA